MKAAERDFFRLIRSAIFANPFGKERLAVDRRAVEEHDGTDKTVILAALVDKVEKSLTRLKERRGFTPGRLNAEEAELYRLAHLFLFFHRQMGRYDQYIDAQVKAGSKALPVPFGREMMAEICGVGISAAEAKRYFSLFFQMRRAYYFISRIVGESPSMCRLRSQLWTTVFSGDIGLYHDLLWQRMEDFSTLLLGETGTGKGMAAAAIGRSGYIPFDGEENFSESFVAAFTEINLSQYAEELIESELFGHRKGAFTGAVENHQGLLARCSPCGSVFLDEIGDVSVAIQIKLLRVLQERRFFPVGSHDSQRFSGRVIAATHQNLDRLRQEGRFRNDFYYRLCSDRIIIPPLRQRLQEDAGELGRLAAVVLQRLLGEENSALAAHVEAWIRRNQPEGYCWPGNIRELEQCIRQFLLTGSYHWQNRAVTDTPGAELAAAIDSETLTAVQLQQRYCRMLHGRHGTYEAVARITGLDRRTVKKYVSGGE